MLVKLLASLFYCVIIPELALCFQRIRFVNSWLDVLIYIYSVLHGHSQAMQKICVSERLCMMHLILHSFEEGGSWASLLPGCTLRS